MNRFAVIFAALSACCTVARAGDALCIEPDLLSSTEIQSAAYHIEVVDDTAYVIGTLFNPKLTVINVADPFAPAVLGSIPLPSSAGGIAVSGNAVFVPTGSTGVRVYDTTDPSKIEEIGVFGALGSARDIAIVDTVAYVAYTSSVQVVDVSDPTSPAGIGQSTSLAAMAERIFVDNGYAYVTDFLDGVLQIFDLSAPNTPTLLGTFEGLTLPSDVASAGSTVYVTDFTGIRIIDASDPASPALLHFQPHPHSNAIAVVGSTMYVADAIGVTIFDVSDPASPAVLGVYDALQPARGVTIKENLAFVADDAIGFQIVDITNTCVTCPADFTGDGTLDVFDVFAFLEAFNTSDPAADFTGDGSYDIFDVFGFLDVFNAGCP